MPTHSITPGGHSAHEGPGPVPRTTHLRHAGAAGGGERWTRTVPVVGGVVYGLYAVWITQNHGFSSGMSWLTGLVAAVATAALGYAIIHNRARMIPEVRAAAFGTLFGAAMGFLHSLTGSSVLRSAGIGLSFGIAMALTSYYVFHWHEQRYGDRYGEQAAGTSVQPTHARPGRPGQPGYPGQVGQAGQPVRDTGPGDSGQEGGVPRMGM
ncbi:hypothetical protein GCM10010218_64870 [Streptomyces mashuensis]|uniref:Uncharacterized protein n=1 Tax=Streptomyces mashuensis TaxID=33904 RepID=A0A919EGK1_9ACTN|nr:hypothetical protein [Streptomyces mashuensis]GHF74873.1 hypothetical protein GCM10010218_64870 [Streptomyces mashuensis]